MPVKISPKKITGAWLDGYALDHHTISSDFIGHDGYGYPRYENKYTPLGELLYRLKSKKDESVIEEIITTASNFVYSKSWAIDLLIPVPPSGNRSFQPVVVLAEKLAKAIGVKFCDNCVTKIKNTPQLKNVFDVAERKKLLSGAFSANQSKIEKKNVLLFDDLYRSGATMNEICSELQRSGKITNIFALTLTKTRRNQ